MIANAHDQILGLDIGSTNVKAVVIDEAGRQLAGAARPVPWQREGEVAELDADVLWGAVLAALADLAAAIGGLGRVRAIGACGQYSSIVPVDDQARPLAPMRLYLDTRGTHHCHEVLSRHPEAFETWLERHPVPPVGGGLALGHLLAFQHDQPELHAATAAYLEPVDYVTARLTGRLTATQASMFAGQVVDNRTLGATEYDRELVTMAGVDPSTLPLLVPGHEPVGRLRADLAAPTGMGEHVEVWPGITDSHAAALATGADAGDRIGIAVGTTGVVLATTDRLAIDLDHEVLTMPGVRPGERLVWAENGLAGRAVEHVLEQFVHPDDVLGDHRTPAGDPFARFDAALAASRPGAGGVRFLPWLSGSMAPQADPTMRGGFVGVSLDSTRVDLVRAAAEGVAHNLRWMLEPVEAFTGRTASEIVLTGGAARSSGWSQLLADVLARPVRTLADPGHAGARAVATWVAQFVHGAAGHDASASPDGADHEWPGLGSRVAARHEPDPDDVGVHDAAHAELRAVFDALRPLRLGA